ncbi:MAG: hypothetical protein ACKVZ0_17200 [Gemmatimonadales bacterium]
MPGPSADTARVEFVSGPRTAAVGEATEVLVRVRTQAGEASAGVRVSIAATGEATLESAESTTGTDGVAKIRLRILGRPGDFDLIASAAGSVSAPHPVHLDAGRPRTIVVLQQPPRTFRPDTAFTVTPAIEVRDAAGNGLAGITISVSTMLVGWLPKHQMRDSKKQEERQLEDLAYPPSIAGPSRFTTGLDGRVELKDVGISGREGVYYLLFRAGDVAIGSELTTYNADYSYRRNFIEIGAIRSLAGLKPADEFFAIRTRFRLNWKLFASLNSDIALSNRSNADSVSSNQRRLTEASAAVDWVPWHVKDPATNIPERGFGVGLAVQVFNTVPYASLRFSAVELKNSILDGSNLSVGYAHGLYQTPIVVDGEVVRPRPHNFIADVYLRSGTVDFFKVLTIRASFLLPVGKGSPLRSRIAVIVPIQTIKWF